MLGGRWLKLAVLALVLAGGAYLIATRTHDLGTAIQQLSAWRVIVAGLLAVVGTWLIERIWFSLLLGLGVSTSSASGSSSAGAESLDAAGVFFVSQLGKYLPGSVWPVLAQMQFGTRWGVAKRVMLAANILLLGMVTASGIAVGALLLPWSSSDGLTRYWWLLILLVPLLFGLHPRVVPAVLDWLFTKAGREPLHIRLSARGLFASAGWAVASWVVLGLHLAVMLGAYHSVSPAALAACVGGIALGWAAGIAFIPAPAGAGIRDAILALTLGPLIGTTNAVTIALASRILLLVADVALAGVGALLTRRAAPLDGRTREI